MRNVGSIFTFEQRVAAVSEYFGWNQMLRAVSRAARKAVSRETDRSARELFNKIADDLEQAARDIEREQWLARKR